MKVIESGQTVGAAAQTPTEEEDGLRRSAPRSLARLCREWRRHLLQPGWSSKRRGSERGQCGDEKCGNSHIRRGGAPAPAWREDCQWAWVFFPGDENVLEVDGMMAEQLWECAETTGFTVYTGGTCGENDGQGGTAPHMGS